MHDQQEEALSHSLHNTQKACRVIKILSVIALVVFLLFWGLSFAFIISETLAIGINFNLIAHSVIAGILISAILALVAKMFSDSSKQRSPFTEKQSKRLVLLATMLFLLTINDVLFPVNDVLLSSAMSQYIGFEITSADTFGAPTINAGTLFFSLLLLCLSVIFRYGYLLQQLNDDTV